MTLQVSPSSAAGLTIKYGGELHFADLTPEYVATGHETSSAGCIAISAEQQPLFDFITAHSDLFPGFL
jgi:hypothetical protein